MRLSLKVLSGLLVFAVVAVGCDAPTSAIQSPGEDVSGQEVASTQKGPPSNGAPANGGEGSHYKATGEVTWTALGVSRTVEFNAHQNAPGKRSERGALKYTRDDGSGYFKGNVTCVNVSPDENVAFFGGVVTERAGVYENRGIEFFLAYVEDGGTPGADGDRVRFEGKSSEEQACTAVDNTSIDGLISDVEEGNLVVHAR